MGEFNISGLFSWVVAFSAVAPVLYFSREIQKDSSSELNQVAKQLISYKLEVPQKVGWVTYFDNFCNRAFGCKLVSLKSISVSFVFTHVALMLTFLILYFSEYMDDEVKVDLVLDRFVVLFYGFNIVTDFLSFCLLRLVVKLFKNSRALLFYFLPCITLVVSMLFVAISLICIDLILGNWSDPRVNVQYFFDWILFRFSSVVDAMHFIIVPSDIIGTGEGYYSSWEYGIWWVVVTSTLWPVFIFSILVYGGVVSKLMIYSFSKVQLVSTFFDQEKPIVAIGWSISLFYWFALSLGKVIATLL
ncbi:TPA: hypothetical protein N2782_004590 [Vibrio parahaemolyticus]|nr:hypothetical protein [Vibrio parahaemolyticus]